MTDLMPTLEDCSRAASHGLVLAFGVLVVAVIVFIVAVIIVMRGSRPTKETL